MMLSLQPHASGSVAAVADHRRAVVRVQPCFVQQMHRQVAPGPDTALPSRNGQIADLMAWASEPSKPYPPSGAFPVALDRR